MPWVLSCTGKINGTIVEFWNNVQEGQEELLPLRRAIFLPSVATGSPTVGHASRFTTFRLIPKFVHFSERRLLGRFSGRGQRLLDVAEAALELFVGGAQCGFRIGTEMAGQVDDSE